MMMGICIRRILTFCRLGVLPGLTLLVSSEVLAAGISGRVTEEATGKPLPMANVVVVGTGIGTSTDANGGFILAGITPGQHNIRATLLGYATRIVTVTVRENEETHLDFALAVSPLRAQPIEVTATRGRERETPVTFENLDRAEIRERYTTEDIPVLLSELPSTTYYSDAGNGIGYTYLTMRGFDSRRIAVMVNGIPQNDPEDHNVYWLDMPDIAGSSENIQVQRGAGSAFYGPPAIGGSVNLVTSDFGRERALSLSAGIGSYNTRKYVASFASGLIDNRYAILGRLSKTLSSGYRDRSWIDFNGYFLGLIRYDETMTTQFNFYGGPVSDHLAYYGIPKADVKNRDLRKANPMRGENELENFSQPHYELFHEWRVTPTLTLNNTFFMVLGTGFFDYDGSWAPYSYYRITSQNGFSITGDPDTLYLPGALIRASVENKQFGWLPRFTIKHTNGELVAGAEVRFHRSFHWGKIQQADEIPFTLPSSYRYYEYKGGKDMLSVYAHELYALQPNMNLMIDLQYAFNRYRLYDEKYLGTDFAVPYHFLNPRIGLNYNIDEKWNSYLSLAYTTREPRLKNLYDAAEASTPVSWGAVMPQFETKPDGLPDYSKPLVKPESLFDIEFGTGYSDPRVRLSANLYWMEFSNEIVNSGQVDRFGQPITGNASRTRHAGIELSGKITPIDILEFSGNLTVSSNKIVRHTDFSTGNPVSLNGNPVANATPVLANLRGTVKMDPVTFSLSGRYVGKQYTDNFKNEENTVDPYFVLNGFVAVTLAHIAPDVSVELKLQVNNIFDTLYAASGQGDEFFVGAERNVFFNLSLSL
jgi:iron complex outermembrane recepter protein